MYKNSAKVGQNAVPYLETDIRTYLDGKLVESFNIDGKTIIYFEDLKPYGEVTWVPGVRAIKMWIDDLPMTEYKELEEASAANKPNEQIIPNIDMKQSADAAFLQILANDPKTWRNGDSYEGYNVKHTIDGVDVNIYYNSKYRGMTISFWQLTGSGGYISCYIRSNMDDDNFEIELYGDAGSGDVILYKNSVTEKTNTINMKTGNAKANQIAPLMLQVIMKAIDEYLMFADIPDGVYSLGLKTPLTVKQLGFINFETSNISVRECLNKINSIITGTSNMGSIGNTAKYYPNSIVPSFTYYTGVQPREAYDNYYHYYSSEVSHKDYKNYVENVLPSNGFTLVKHIPYNTLTGNPFENYVFSKGGVTVEITTMEILDISRVIIDIE